MKRRSFMALLGGLVGALPGVSAIAALKPASLFPLKPSGWTNQYHILPIDNGVDFVADFAAGHDSTIQVAYDMQRQVTLVARWVQEKGTWVTTYISDEALETMRHCG